MKPGNPRPLHLPPAAVLRQRLLGVLLAVLAISTPICYYRNRAVTEHEQPALSHKVAAMCRTMSGSCDAVSDPRRYNETLTLPHSQKVIRHLLSVGCQADGRHFVLLFNEKTGHLCSVFGDSGPASHHRATITTPDEAADIALLRLRQLDMVPDNALLACAEAPKTIRKQSAWQILWKVKRPGSDTIDRIKMILDSTGGYPLHIVDMHEMKQFTAE